MIGIFTDFSDTDLPLITAVCDEENESVYELYMSGTKKKLIDVIRDKAVIVDASKNQPIICNDCQKHLRAFEFDDVQLYEGGFVELPNKMQNRKQAAVRLANQFSKMKPALWRGLSASAAIVYNKLTSTPILCNGQLVQPKYDQRVFSGRSRTREFNIQGANADLEIRDTNHERSMFVHFDWVAADWRVIGIMSGDEQLSDSFVDSDPYTFAADKCNIDRDEAKSCLLRSLYSVNFDSDVLAIYKDARDWMASTCISILDNGCSDSILKRRFYGDDLLSVFNASVQGSVAHAMHYVISHLPKAWSSHLFAEVHDSLVFSCSINEVAVLIRDVVEVMRRPFRLVSEYDCVFPIRVSVGTKWKRWKTYRVMR